MAGLDHRPRRRLAQVVASGLIGSSVLWPTAGVPARGGIGLAGGEHGTVETIAGPGFCPGEAIIDAASVSVEGLAVDLAGTMHVATGPAAEDLVVRVDDLGRPVLLQGPGSEADAAHVPAPPGGRQGRQVASDGGGGALVASGNLLIQLDERGRTTIAGGAGGATADGGGASAGDGGPAEGGRFRRLLAIATDNAGDAYVADEIDPRAATVRIRFINRSNRPRTFYGGTDHEITVAPGNIATVAGAEVASSNAEAPAPAAVLAGGAQAMAVFGERLYVASHATAVDIASGHGRVRVVNLGAAPSTAHGASLAPGAVATVVGGDRQWPGGALGQVTGMAADDQGNLYLADRDHHRVLKVDPSGAATSFAGTGVAGFDGNGRSATAAKLNRPFDVEAGPWGRIYISDQGNGQVRYVDADGLIQAALGNGAALRWTCEGASGARPVSTEQARPGAPSSVVSDADGNLYVAVPSLAQVKQITSSGRVTTVVGRREGPAHCEPALDCSDIGDGHRPTDARLLRPAVLALRPGGGLYILDTGDARIRLVNLGSRPFSAHGVRVQPRSIETVAGNGSVGSSGDGGDALSAQLLNAGSLAADPHGNLFVADSTRVRRIDPEGVITTFVPPASSNEAAARCCRMPTGVAVDGSGNLFVADGAGGQLWVINRASETVTTNGVSVGPGSAAVVAGHGNSGANAMLTATEVTAGSDGSLYVVGEDMVQSVDPRGVVTTLAGSGTLGFNGDGLKARLTNFNGPTDLTLDRCGNLVVADQNNDRVRRIMMTASCAADAFSPRGDRGLRGLHVLVLVVLAVAVGMAAAFARRRTG